ncbi:MAG TPA: radical SAM protein [Gemmatimonadaceae bacterium]|jgi:MoaA/NifB/PqqE/SkfB family radical SAM enzyme|nr:radical SAM protein [Gemmatimonadaceae bacterium]
MLTSEFKPWHVPIFAVKYAYLTVTRRPVLVNFEVTMRCNARCGFCDYWKTDPSAKSSEIKSFADAARFFSPMVVTFTGGEPTLRSDLEDLVAGVNDAISYKYMTLLTHGGMLSPERARSLWKAGINQFNISLDFLDARHDQARGIPGLSAKIMRTIPRMREIGITGIRFNTVIKRDNLDQLMPIVRRARELGCGVNFSCYTDAKNGNTDGLIERGQTRDLEDAVREILAFKKKTRGVITNSDHYLEQIPRYVRGEITEACRSGMRTIHIDPLGRVKRCPDFPTDFHWTEFRKYEPIDCNACFYACRGEAQAPLRLSRIRDIMASPKPLVAQHA